VAILGVIADPSGGGPPILPNLGQVGAEGQFPAREPLTTVPARIVLSWSKRAKKMARRLRKISFLFYVNNWI
jgi:hypothetical protein